MKRIDRELAALPTMSLTTLREKWETFGVGPAPSVPENLLRRLVAQRLQEKHYGKMPTMVARELERLSNGQPEPKPKGTSMMPGARLIREWNGRMISVEVRSDGFIWEERSYRSLSQIAREVTGARWSGPRFFGVVKNG